MGEPDSGRAKIILTIAALIIICAVVLFWLKFAESREFRVIFFNVGQGDAALIRFPSGAKMLVDCGMNRDVLRKLGKYLPFYDRTIDYLLITHPDTDHYGGCADVLRRYDVKKVITNGTDKDADSYWQVWKGNLLSENAVESVATAGMQIGESGVTLEFFNPNSALRETDDNNNSLAFRLTYGTTTIFFSGDIEEKTEKNILARYCGTTTIMSGCDAVKSEYLKVAHHGSDSSSNEDFLRAVFPSYAVISVGKNRFGHPSLRVMRKLERADAVIWRTDEVGDIIIR